jgi:Kelch motif
VVIHRPDRTDDDTDTGALDGEAGEGSRRPVAVLMVLVGAVLVGLLASSPATAPDPAQAPQQLAIERLRRSRTALPEAFAESWTPPAPGGWTALPEAPIGSRIHHTVVGVHDGILVWGGYQQGRPLRNGAIFRLSTGRWEQIPDAPVPDDDHVPVMARNQLLLLDEQTPMAYDLSAGSWRQLPRPPVPEGLFLSDLTAWTSRLAVVLTGRTGRPAGSGLLFDPEVERWAEISPPPVTLTRGHDLVWDGRDLLLFGPSPGGVEGFGRRLRFDLGGVPPRRGTDWTSVPGPPLDDAAAQIGQARALAVGNPPRVFVTVVDGSGGRVHLLEYAPTISGERAGIWHDWGDPSTLSRTPVLAWTGENLLAVTPEGGLRYDRDAARISPIPSPEVPINSFAEVAWSGPYLVWWGGADGAGAIWHAPGGQ